MPDVRNCRRCGKIYNYIGGAPICPMCREADEQDFKRVKEYLYKNPGATLSEVSTVLEVSVERIKMYLKEGRLEIINNEGNMILECEGCGKAIPTGRLCDLCSRELSNEFRSTASTMNSNNTAKPEIPKKDISIRYLNKDGKR